MNPLDDQIQELQSLLQDLLQGIQDILQSGELLSDEFQGEVARTLNLLTDRIDGLIEERNRQGAPPIPPLEPAMPSSNVSAFRYDDKNQRLMVQFLGDYPNREGSVYSYDGVPPQIFDLFRKGAIPARTDGKNRWGKWWKGKVPSMGASLYTLLKQAGYPYQRLS